MQIRKVINLEYRIARCLPVSYLKIFKAGQINACSAGFTNRNEGENFTTFVKQEI